LIILISVILIIFGVLLAGVWVWFYRTEGASADSLYNSAEKAFAEGEYKKAKELFLKLLAVNPNYKDTTYQLGMTQLKLEQHAEAKQSFEQVLKTAPKNFDALLNFAQALQSQNDFEGAIEAYDRALKENDKSAQCYLGQGLIYFQQKNYEKALELFDKVKELSPDNTQALFYTTSCEAELGSFESDEDYLKVISEYEKLSENPDLPNDFNTSLALAYAKSGQIGESLNYCKKALAINTEDVEAYKILGLLQFVKMDLEGAKSSLSTALSLQPSHEEAHKILSYVLCQQQDKCALKECREKYYQLIKKFLK